MHKSFILSSITFQKFEWTNSTIKKIFFLGQGVVNYLLKMMQMSDGTWSVYQHQLPEDSRIGCLNFCWEWKLFAWFCTCIKVHKLSMLEQEVSLQGVLYNLMRILSNLDGLCVFGCLFLFFSLWHNNLHPCNGQQQQQWPIPMSIVLLSTLFCSAHCSAHHQR
jgi:hypothetical protein